MKIIKFIPVILLAIGLASCANEQYIENPIKDPEKKYIDKDQIKNEKIIYTSFYPIYNITKQIAGDKYEVRSFTNLKTESHGWEPSAKDITDLASASLLITNGAGMEEWEDGVDGSLDIEIIDSSEDVDLLDADISHHHDHSYGHYNEDDDHHDEHNHDQSHSHDEDHDHDHDHNHGGHDPHTWLSPINAKAQAKVICDNLIKVDPENKDYYMANYEKIITELDEIIDEYMEKFENVSHRNFVITHAAFSYLARDFNLNQIALSGLMSTDDTSAKGLVETINKAKELGITTIFYEKGGSDKEARTLASEINAEITPLNTMEFATDEDLENNTTYQELTRLNLEALYQSMK